MFRKMMSFVYDIAIGHMNSLNLFLSSQVLHKTGSLHISPLIEKDIKETPSSLTHC